MSSVNKVILVGNLGTNPETRDFPNGNQVCILSVATSNTWTDKNGDSRQKTEWHQVAIFEKSLIRLANQQLVTGSKVYVEGQLRTNKYTDRQGIVRYSTQIVLRGFKGVLIPTAGQESRKLAARDSPHKATAKPVDQFDSHRARPNERSDESTDEYLDYVREFDEFDESIEEAELEEIEHDIQLLAKMQRENPIALSDHYYQGTKFDVDADRESDLD